MRPISLRPLYLRADIVPTVARCRRAAPPL